MKRINCPHGEWDAGRLRRSIHRERSDVYDELSLCCRAKSTFGDPSAPLYLPLDQRRHPLRICSSRLIHLRHYARRRRNLYMYTHSMYTCVRLVWMCTDVFRCRRAGHSDATRVNVSVNARVQTQRQKGGRQTCSRTDEQGANIGAHLTITMITMVGPAGANTYFSEPVPLMRPLH